MGRGSFEGTVCPPLPALYSHNHLYLQNYPHLTSTLGIHILSLHSTNILVVSMCQVLSYVSRKQVEIMIPVYW